MAFKVEIRQTDVNGIPTNTVLASSNFIPASEVTRDAFYTFTFPSLVPVIPGGGKYAVVLVQTFDYGYDAQKAVGWVFSNADNPYLDGWKLTSQNNVTWTSDLDKDHYFKVFYDAPQTSTLVEHEFQFNQDNAFKWFVSTDNTMELDMRFRMGLCIDGSASMIWSDVDDLRISETLLFIREIFRRAEFSYVDVWTFGDSISENTFDGPTDLRPDYSAALGSITSDGDESRLWTAADEAIGNLDAQSIVDAIIREDQIDDVLELMRQMNRIDYAYLATLDPTYDSATGFPTIANHGVLVNYLIYQYAETMASFAVIISDGFDNVGDMQIEEVAITANAIRGDNLTPIFCFALGNSYDNTNMYYLSENTNGLLYQLGDNVNTRFRESYDEILNDKEKTIFQGAYEDEVWFGELTFLSMLELGVSIPLTSDLKLEVAFSYDGLTFEAWQVVATNTRVVFEQFIYAFRFRVIGWLGNIYGGNYYDIYGNNYDYDSVTSSLNCRQLQYYGYEYYQYYGSYSDYYYYRDQEYPSPKIYSFKYWTVDPAIEYKFTEPQTSDIISEYMFAPNVDLPENAILDWGVVRGNSTDWNDTDPIMNNRIGVLPNRTKSIYFTPDVNLVGLGTAPMITETTGVSVYRVVDASGAAVTWGDTAVVTVKINGFVVDITVTPYQLVGDSGLIYWLENPRPTTDVVTADVKTPGAAHIRNGELAISDNRRIYYAQNLSWPWDATITVRVNDEIIRGGYISYPEDGAIMFLKELQSTDVVTIEIQHSNVYRVGYRLKNYTNDAFDEPDFGFTFSKEQFTDTSVLVTLSDPPVASEVTLSPTAPSLTDRLVVSYIYSQVDNNAETGTTIQWYFARTGETNYTHNVAYDNRNVMRVSDVPATNPGGPFQEFDSWYVVVTPRDANGAGVAVPSNIVHIGGYAPPYVSTATILDADGAALLTDDSGNLISVQQDLTASYVYHDPNTGGTGSDKSTMYWYKNGVAAVQYTTIYPDVTLPSNKLVNGDVWYYVVIPFDGNNNGDRFNSDEVIITQSKIT